LAIGGPFLGGHKLRISARAATWDGAPILTSFPSQWSNAQPPISIQYNGQGGLVDATLTPNEPMKIAHLSLPLGITMQINRWVSNKDGDYINVKITMQKQPNQDGHCGNFNGNVADDARTQVRSRIGKTGVPQSELLFDIKTPVVVANRPDLSNCPEQTMAQAKDLCSKKGGESAECLIDVCFGGPKFATQ